MTQLETDLLAVKAEIDRRGWCQLKDVQGKEGLKDWSQDDALPICVGLACSKVSGFSQKSSGTRARYSSMLEAIGKAAGIHVEGQVFGVDVFKWNDAKGRTKEEVYAVLDAAIVAASTSGN